MVRLFAWLGGYDRLGVRRERNAQTCLVFLFNRLRPDHSQLNIGMASGPRPFDSSCQTA
jgi:hypothetical protein